MDLFLFLAAVAFGLGAFNVTFSRWTPNWLCMGFMFVVLSWLFGKEVTL